MKSRTYPIEKQKFIRNPIISNVQKMRSKIEKWLTRIGLSPTMCVEKRASRSVGGEGSDGITSKKRMRERERESIPLRVRKSRGSFVVVRVRMNISWAELWGAQAKRERLKPLFTTVRVFIFTCWGSTSTSLTYVSTNLNYTPSQFSNNPMEWNAY